MKIAIVTLHRIFNYGSALQAYATQKVFGKLGHEAEIVDYITPQRTMKKLVENEFSNVSQKGIVKARVRQIAKIVSLAFRQCSFGAFVEHNLNLSKKYITADDLQKDPPVADLYVTGSDQTWNSKYNEGIDRGFFLDFLPPDSRRISYVASFGREKLPLEEYEETKKYLARYSNLSVREDSARDILEALGFPNAVQLIDPTLQLTKDDWGKLASKRLIKEPYLLLFILYNEDCGATEYARKIADQLGLKVVKLSWELFCPKGVDRLMTHRSPEDFLSLMLHAKFVVTNSFHGLAFSINLEKQFVVVPRNEFNSRIESLLRLTGLEERMVSQGQDCCSVAEKQIDYVPVNQVLEKERIRARTFLEEQLSYSNSL